MLGLTCSIYRWQHDTTNNGMTARGNSLHVVTLIDDRPGAEPLGPFEPLPSHPAVYLREWKGRIIACPEPLPRVGREARTLAGWMFGGNFIYTSDGRFPNEYPIPVYDRREA